MTELANKVVAITGGGTGIGAGIAKELAIAGCRVIIGGRREEPLRKLADSVASPHPIHCKMLDVAENDSIRDFFTEVRATFGSVDILVNSAGINIQNRTMASCVGVNTARVDLAAFGLGSGVAGLAGATSALA